MDHILFIYASDDGHLGFHLSALVNSAAMNIHVQAFEHLFSILLGIYLGVKLLGHTVILFNCFEESSNCFPQFYIPTSNERAPALLLSVGGITTVPSSSSLLPSPCRRILIGLYLSCLVKKSCLWGSLCSADGDQWEPNYYNKIIKITVPIFY